MYRKITLTLFSLLQDSLYFLKKFFSEITGSSTDMTSEKDVDTKSRSRSASGASGPSAPPPVMKVGQPLTPEGDTEATEPLMMFSEMQKSSDSREATDDEAMTSSDSKQKSTQSDSPPVFIKWVLVYTSI